MNVRMGGHFRAPALEHGGGSNARTEVLGISGDCEQRFGRRAEHQVVDDRLVLVGDWSDLGRQCEDHVEIADRQQIGLAGCDPIRRRRALTLWAMAVATGVVRDAAVATIFATFDMPAERGRAALLDRRDDLELIQAHMPGIGSTPVGSMAMKDVCDLQPRAAHRPRLGLGSRPPLGPCYEPVEWAGYGPGRGVGDASVKRRCVELGVTQKSLNHANIDILLEQMRGEAVPQRVWRHALCDPRGLGGGADNAAELPGRQRLDRVAPWKPPASRQQQAAPTPLPPPGPPQFEQLRGHARMAVLTTLAALDAQQHAPGIDIADLE